MLGRLHEHIVNERLHPHHFVSKIGEIEIIAKKRQNPFKLRDFRGVKLEYVSKLEVQGVKIGGHVKGIRARLYYDAGIDSVEKMADWEPEALRRMVAEFVARTGFDGVPPLPREVSSTVANAQKLPKIVEY